MLRRGKDRAAALVNVDADRSAVEAARRDPRAFEALYRKYVAQVYNFALYELRDTHAAEDLTAQVFLRALAGLRHFREQGDGTGSSFRVAMTWMMPCSMAIAATGTGSARSRCAATWPVAASSAKMVACSQPGASAATAAQPTT